MRKVSKESVHNVETAVIAENFGELFNEEKEWTDEMIDTLLDAFLAKQCMYISKRESLLSLCGRSYVAIANMIWKLSMRYPRKSVQNYTPHKRENRTGRRFTSRDLAIIERATSRAGIHNKAYTPEYLGKILGRNQIEVDNWMKKIANNNSTFFKEETEYSLENQARAVHDFVKGSYKNAMESL